jgi:hypothetical protein
VICRRYEKAQKPLEAFEADISKYHELVDDISAEVSSETIKYLFLDCGPLKQVGCTPSRRSEVYSI